MPTLTEILPADADDSEMAAIIAAISAQQASIKSDAEPPAERILSNWRIAGILEATGRSRRMTSLPIKGSSDPLWKAANLPKAFSLILCLGLVALPVQGNEFAPISAPDVVTDNTDMVPPQAPSYARRATTFTSPPRNQQQQQQQPSMRDTRPPALLRPALPQAADARGFRQAEGFTPSEPQPPADACEPGVQNTPAAAEAQMPPQNRNLSMIRVALSLDAKAGSITVPDGATIRDATTGNTLAELPPQSQWQLALKSNGGGSSQIAFTGKITNVARSEVLIASRNHYRDVGFVYGSAAPSDVSLVPIPTSRTPQFWLPLQRQNEGVSAGRMYFLEPPAGGTFAVGGKLYRGSLAIRPILTNPPADASNRAQAGQPRVSSFNLVNYLYLEEYLLSVVPSEMPSSWPLEALKAQTIAARSFAMARSAGRESGTYDVKATIEDQVYTGVGAESSNSNRAVAETEGQVLTHSGKVITAFFHSASGGFTEVSDNVWSKSVPYLKAVADYDDDSPHFAWNRTFNVADTQKALESNGKGVGTLLAILPVARGISPRVRWLLVTGTDRTVFISGETARKVFSLPSSSFNVGTVEGAYHFAGRGFGHGLGMSQWGAKKLATAGYTAAQILAYYYKDVTIQRF